MRPTNEMRSTSTLKSSIEPSVCQTETNMISSILNNIYINRRSKPIETKKKMMNNTSVLCLVLWRTWEQMKWTANRGPMMMKVGVG